VLQQSMPSTGAVNGMSGFTKVSQRSRDNGYGGTGTGSAGSLAHASNYFNAAKYALQVLYGQL